MTSHDNVTDIPPELQDFASLMLEEVFAKLRVKINDGGWTIDEQREILDCIVAEQEVKHRLRADLATLRKQLENAREALRFYANWHPQPSEGPWGASSTDFGEVAREALKGKS